MDYDDAALLADQQNWRPWFERGSFFFYIGKKNMFFILKFSNKIVK